MELASKYSGPKSHVYAILEQNNYFLPTYSSSCITRDFLENWLQKRVPTIKQTDVVSINFQTTLTNVQVYLCYFSDLQTTELGFRFNRLPPKDWLLKYFVKIFPNNRLSQLIAKLNALYQNLGEALDENFDESILQEIYQTRSLINAEEMRIKLHKKRRFERLKEELINNLQNKLAEKFLFLRPRKIERINRRLFVI